MLKRNYILLLTFFCAAEFVFAQSDRERTYPEFSFNRVNNSDISFSGNLEVDKKLSFDEAEKEISKLNLNPQVESEKSPWLATLFSVILPGAGEFYAQSYLKAGIFVAIEAAVITTAVIYNKKGNDQTDEFQKYADNVTTTTGWSAVRYAEWLNQYYSGDITINSNQSLPPWERVSFSQINSIEAENSDLSHQLAPHGEQQYYEMIGKYHQFRAGWADYSGGIAFDVSPMFHLYASMRGQANDYYNTASKAVIGIYINHFLSAIDAYWSTTVYNKDLVAKITVENKQYVDIIELVPTLNVKLSF